MMLRKLEGEATLALAENLHASSLERKEGLCIKTLHVALCICSSPLRDKREETTAIPRIDYK